MFNTEVIARGESDTEVATTITYVRENPYEVSFLFPEIEDDDREWIFARDILVDALKNGAAGSGDVRAVVRGSVFSVTLGSMSAQGGFTLDFSTTDMARLVNQTLIMVPRGTESTRLDSIITDSEINGWFFDTAV